MAEEVVSHQTATQTFCAVTTVQIPLRVRALLSQKQGLLIQDCRS